MIKNILILLCISTNVELLHAQPASIDTDRPDQTESPFLVPKKLFQIESGFLFEKNNNIKNFLQPTTLIRYGLFENFELRLNADFQSIKEENNSQISGWSPVEIGLKTNLCQENKFVPQISLLAHLVLPKIASDKFQTDYLAPEIIFTLKNTLINNLSLGYNLGVVWDGITPAESYVYTLSLALSNSEHISTFIEFFGNTVHNSKSVNNLDAGIIYLLNNNLQLDISGGIQLTDDIAKNYFVGFGISCRFPK